MERLEVEPSARQAELTFLIGYYGLMLSNLSLSPDWREAYEQRQQDLQGELDANT